MSELDSTSTSTSSSIKQQTQKAITATTGVDASGTVTNKSIKSEINIKIKNEDKNVKNNDDGGEIKAEGESKNGGVCVAAPAAVPVHDGESSTSYSSSGQDTRISLIQVRTYIRTYVLSHSYSVTNHLFFICPITSFITNSILKNSI